MRELLGKNKSRSEKVLSLSTKAPVEFAENPQLPGTKSGAETQSSSNMELTSLGEPEIILNVPVVGETVSEDGEQGAGVENMGVLGQDLEECNLEFQMTERQLKFLYEGC